MTNFIDSSDNHLSLRLPILSSAISTSLTGPLLKRVQKSGRGWWVFWGDASLAPQNDAAEQAIGSSGITLVSAQAPD
jgi:hypothetical protein